MKLTVLIISTLFFASANAQQSSLELFNEQQKKENLKKQLERDKEALRSQKQKELADNIVNKGLLTVCSSSSYELDRMVNFNNSYVGAAYYKGNQYIFNFYKGNYSGNCEPDKQCVVANGGYYRINMKDFVEPYIVRNGGNQILVKRFGHTEEELYIRESLEVTTKNINTKPERKKFECLIMNKESAEYK